MDRSEQSLQSVMQEDGAAILDVDNGTITTLNPTGAYVWKRLQQGETIEAIVHDLAVETGQDEQHIEQDVRDFVASLRSTHLLPM